MPRIQASLFSFQKLALMPSSNQPNPTVAAPKPVSGDHRLGVGGSVAEMSLDATESEEGTGKRDSPTNLVLGYA